MRASKRLFATPARSIGSGSQHRSDSIVALSRRGEGFATQSSRDAQQAAAAAWQKFVVLVGELPTEDSRPLCQACRYAIPTDCSVFLTPAPPLVEQAKIRLRSSRLVACRWLRC